MPPRIALGVFAALSLAAVLAGCGIAAASGVSAPVWLKSLGAWTIGALLAAAIAVHPLSRRSLLLVMAAGVIGLAATWSSPGQLGVHRWLQFGPLTLNAAALLLPGVIVAFSACAVPAIVAAILAGLITVLMVLQPDASQATAFSAAALVFLLSWSVRPAAKLNGAAALAAATAIAWTRADPLAPVAEVESILKLAIGLSGVVAVGAAALIGAAALTPVLLVPRGDGTVRAAAMALTAYFTAAAITPIFGAFPVPLVGISMSPIIGAWLGMALLAYLAADRGRA